MSTGAGRTPSYGERLAEALAMHGGLCLGIDAHASLLEAWGLPDTAEGARSLGLRSVEAAAGTVGIVKPQVAFYERFGSAGFAALEAVLADARDAGLLVVADAKRGDIGSTMDGYAGAWLTPGSPLEVDALTVSPYLGVGSLQPAFAAALAHDKGLYVLAATSNAEGPSVQLATVAGRSLAATILDDVEARNAAVTSELGPFGVVIGATVDAAAYGLDLGAAAHTSILGPGFGAQGGRLRDARARFGAAAPRLLANVSREALAAGPDGLAARLRMLRDELEQGVA